MHALIVTFGSTGDVYPMIGLAKALQQHGHDVCLATSDIFAPEIEQQDISFHALPPDWTLADFKQFTAALCSTNNRLKQFGMIYERFGPFVDDIATALENKLQDFDILISTYLFPCFKFIAEKQHKPFVTVAFCHNIVPRWDRPPEDMLALTWLPTKWQHQWNHFWWRCTDAILSRRINQAFRKYSRSINVDVIGSFIFDSAETIIVATPQALLQQAALIDERFHITGYLRHQSPVDPHATEWLDAFCQGETVPILTFGSMVAHDAQLQLDCFLATWPNTKKLIVQAGWADLTIPHAPNLLRLEKLSHDQLFPYASVVVHHGGAGTTASVLYAGKPHIIIPHLGDQFFWANEIVTHGLGLELNYRHWPRKLQATIELIEQHSHYTTHASAMATKLQEEDGDLNAVRVVSKQ